MTLKLSECLSSVDTPQGRSRVADYLGTRPFPRYEPAPGHIGFLVRIEEDGKRVVGRFIGRTFQVLE
jgi:hypothetical protein